MTVFPGILYHGTDERILGYCEAERKELSQLCYDIAAYSYNKLVADGFSIYRLQDKKQQYSHILGNRWIEFITCFQQFDSRKRRSELYNYNSLFLTNSRERAIRYAKNTVVLGEQGHVASVLSTCVSALFDLNCDYDKEIGVELKRFQRYAGLEPEPVLVAFSNVALDELLRENGETIDWVKELSLFTGNKIQASFRLAPSSQLAITGGVVERLNYYG